MKNDGLNTSITNNLYGLWRQMNGTNFLRFYCFSVIKFFKLKSSSGNFPLVVKFFNYFGILHVGSLHIGFIQTRVNYKPLSYNK